LVGHGGTAVALGGSISEVRLFWFAGGWIRYASVPTGVGSQLAIAMGGIAIELVIGTLVWALVRGDTLGRRIVRALGAALIVHAGWYLATGAWHGYGDGALLYRELGVARYPVAIVAGLVTCAAAFAGARVVIGALAATLPDTKVAGTIVAFVLAAGLQAGLGVAEIHLRADPTYGRIMQPEKERLVDRDLARWAEYERSHGHTISDDERDAQHAKLESEHRTFPFAWLLGACALVAGIAGSVRARPSTTTAIAPRLIAIAAACAAVAIAAVIAIDLAL
jgi:hypothetical protein